MTLEETVQRSWNEDRARSPITPLYSLLDLPSLTGVPSL